MESYFFHPQPEELHLQLCFCSLYLVCGYWFVKIRVDLFICTLFTNICVYVCIHMQTHTVYVKFISLP